MSQSLLAPSAPEQTTRSRKLAKSTIVVASLAVGALICAAVYFSGIPAPSTLATSITGANTLSEHAAMESFDGFMRKFNKIYLDTEEKSKRFNIYKENLAFIEAHNQSSRSYSVAVNQFADMSFEEFRKHYLGYKKPAFMSTQGTHPDHKLAEAVIEDLPTEVDWRAKNCVTPVKNQGQCGSCWAFSATGAIEGAQCIKTGTLPDLSEQELVDCAGGEYQNQGCSGGLMDFAFNYVYDHGLCSEADYPYEGVEGKCRASKCKVATSDLEGFFDVPADSEAALMKAVANHGPVSIAIEADQMAFQFYSRGVFDARCGTELDHGVLLVGYGVESGKNFWLVKNSWGAGWGDDGYIKLIRNSSAKKSIPSGGECGLMMQPSYPTYTSEDETPTEVPVIDPTEVPVIDV